MVSRDLNFLFDYGRPPQFPIDRVFIGTPVKDCSHGTLQSGIFQHLVSYLKGSTSFTLNFYFTLPINPVHRMKPNREVNKELLARNKKTRSYQLSFSFHKK